MPITLPSFHTGTSCKTTRTLYEKKKSWFCTCFINSVLRKDKCLTIKMMEFL